jgi:hypothetical protein
VPRKTAKQIAAETRPRIDATKKLTLDERIEIVRNLLTELRISKLPPTTMQLTALTTALKARGYEPMMFKAACTIILSEQRSNPL